VARTFAKKIVVILAHALLGWALCAATIGMSLRIVPLVTALTIHAVGAPIFFALVSWNYFKRFRFTSALQTAAIFVSIVVLMDFVIVALLIQGSLAMFASLLGTWIPFVLIFVSTYSPGRWWAAFGGKTRLN
jgi:hypothetical protein